MSKTRQPLSYYDCMRRMIRATVVPVILAGSAVGAEPLRLGKARRQLFFDDQVIAEMRNLERTVNQPVKHPQNPLLEREHPWEAFRVQVYGTVIYYSGSAAKHGTDGELNIGMDIGLATLRRDGWISLDAGRTTGALKTKAFIHPGGELHVNVDAKQGAVVVQLQDPEGKPLAGYDRGEVTGTDSLEARVRFTDAEQADPAGTPVKLRLELTNAKLFSFWFE